MPFKVGDTVTVAGPLGQAEIVKVIPLAHPHTPWYGVRFADGRYSARREDELTLVPKRPEITLAVYPHHFGGYDIVQVSADDKVLANIYAYNDGRVDVRPAMRPGQMRAIRPPVGPH